MAELIYINQRGTDKELWAYFCEMAPEIPDVFTRIRSEQNNRYEKRETRVYEAALLYIMAQQYNRSDAQILEIGMCYGWTAAVMHYGAPLAHILTMSPNPSHYHYGKDNLTIYPNVEARKERSEVLLATYNGPELDMIFVDGDHKAAKVDVPWYNWLKPDGLMIWHDYCPDNCPVRPCRWVYDAVNQLVANTHEPDVFIANDDNEGVLGLYRREGEVWPNTQR